MAKRYLLLTVALIIGLGFVYVGFFQDKSQSSTSEPQMEVQDEHESDEYHIHAGFQVYESDQQIDFAKLEYMQISPCSEDHEEHDDLTPEEEQIEKAHLHDMVGDVVHSHIEHATWGDLFQNIKYQILPNATAYINGEKVENILEKEITPYESVVIFVGENTDIENKLDGSVTREHIEEIEAQSENCGAS